MPKLPIVSGRDTVKALEKMGFNQVRQRGSHVVMRKGAYGTVVPLHSEIDPGTLFTIIKQSGITIDDFRALLK